MPLVTQSFEQFVSNWVTSWAASMEVDANLPEGDPALATATADASQAIALQAIAEQTVLFARATTSTGVDLDSWMAQFGFPRLPAVNATGTVTFSSLAPLAQPAYVPAGTVIQAPGGAIQYQVVADPTQPQWIASANAYVLPAGQTTVNATVEALIAGSAANVQANTLTQIVNTLFGIPVVNNAGAIQDGTNAESDAAYRARFVEYINGLSKATYDALLEAIGSVQAGLKISLFENIFAVGNPPSSIINPYYGNILALIDDGSGNPSTNLINAVKTAVNNTRAFSIQYQVLPPTIITPSIQANVRIGTGYNTGPVETNVKTSVVDYVNSLPIGGDATEHVIYLSQIELSILIVPGVMAIEPASLLVDGEEQDLAVAIYQEALIAATNVSVGTY